MSEQLEIFVQKIRNGFTVSGTASVDYRSARSETTYCPDADSLKETIIELLDGIDVLLAQVDEKSAPDF